MAHPVGGLSLILPPNIKSPPNPKRYDNFHGHSISEMCYPIMGGGVGERVFTVRGGLVVASVPICLTHVRTQCVLIGPCLGLLWRPMGLSNYL